MADIEGLIPHLLKWEAGTVQRSGEALADCFTRAKKKGYSDDKTDGGGATMCGVTLATYRRHHRGASVSALKGISYSDWLAILKSDYWDKWCADHIVSQGVANMLVDWVWHSGAKYGIGIPQSILGVDVDYIVGSRTLSALNASDGAALFERLREGRLSMFDRIVKTRPEQKRYLQGWRNRVNDIRYE